MSKLYRVKIEDFCTFFDQQLKLKYESQSLLGLRQRFQAVMFSFKDSLKITIELHNVIEAKIGQIEKQIQGEKKDSSHLEIQRSKLLQLYQIRGRLTSIICIMNGILCEYSEQEILNLYYLQKFYTSIQNRVEYIYGTFQQLERLEVYREVIMMQKPLTLMTSILYIFGLSNGYSGDSLNVDLLREIDRLIRMVPF